MHQPKEATQALRGRCCALFECITFTSDLHCTCSYDVVATISVGAPFTRQGRTSTFLHECLPLAPATAKNIVKRLPTL